MDARPIVVGFDGSTHAQAALMWAMDEASRASAAVDVVFARDWFPESVVDVLIEAADAQAWERAEHLVDRAVSRAREAAPLVEVTGRVESGRASSTLCAASASARMVVVGARGRGGLAGTLVGSVGVAVATHAHCPVVVVRDRPPERDALPVVVGVDDSAEARRAIDFGFAEAAIRKVELLVVRGWRPPIPDAGSDHLRRELIAEIETAERAFLDEVVATQAARYPEVSVRTRLVIDGAVAALIDASRTAQLVVVGSRGRGGFRGLLVGSVGLQVLHHAECPVAVVR